MYSSTLKNSIKLVNSLILALTFVSCSSNQLNTTLLNNPSIEKTNLSVNKDIKSFRIKDGVTGATPEGLEAYYLAYADIRQGIKNKTIPDTMYHYVYAFNNESSRLSATEYTTIKNRISGKEWSEEAYLIANPDVKASVTAGTIPSGYSHWYTHAIVAETSRTTSTAYTEAKAATDLGFSEKAYRMAYPDIDNLVKSGSLPSAYAHWNTYAKNNETSRLSSTNYIKIKRALDLGFEEQAYLLAYPDVKSLVTAGTLPNALKHYIDYGVNENRLETLIYQDAKLAIMLDFDETRYRTAFPDVVSAINIGGFASGFQHYSMHGKHEGRLTQQPYLDTKNPDLKINTYTTSTQTNPSIAMDNAGNYVVTWTSSNQESGTSSDDIYAQRYNSSGIPIGTEFRVNTYTTNFQTNPSVAMDNVGNFVVTWQSTAQASVTSGNDIYAQRYSSDTTLTPIGAEFKINTYTTNSQSLSSVAMDNSGNFVVTWHSTNQSSATSSNDIYAQRYSSATTLTTIGTEFKINTYTTNAQTNPSVAMDNVGNFVVTWTSQNQASGTSSYDIYAKRYSSATTLTPIGTEFKINTYTTDSQQNSSVAMDNIGNFVVTWQSNNQASGTSSNDIYAQRYSSSSTLTPIGTEFKVNTYTTNAQTNPSVAMDNAGNFVVTWQSNNQASATSSNDIYAQRYSSSSTLTPIGTEFKVNTYTTNAQTNPSVAMDNVGNFVVTWYSFSQTSATSSNDIYGKRYAS